MRERISWVVVTLGIVLGLIYMLFVAPVALFTIGKNDSLPEIVATAALLMSTLPASIYALFSRRQAGIWLTLVSLCGAATSAWNTYSVLTAKGIRVEFGEVFGSALVDILAIVIGLFFWITGALGWPNLKARKGRVPHPFGASS
jgi:hypothetical protein